MEEDSLQEDSLSAIYNTENAFVYDMQLHGEMNMWDCAQTRAKKDLPKGANLYAVFQYGSSKVKVTATYNGANKWAVSSAMKLESGSNGKCVIAYFEDMSQSASSSAVFLSDASAAYADSDARWSVDGGIIHVYGSLVPIVSRIRFNGTKNSSISISGITSLKSFNRNTGEFVETTSPVLRTIGADGKSSYVYGTFTDKSNPSFDLFVKSVLYKKECSNGIFTVGESGYMDLPISGDKKGWTEVANLQTSGTYSNHTYVDLGLSVKWASFNVGGSNPEDTGGVYAWGEVDAKNNYDWSTYKWCKGTSTSLTKYCYHDYYGKVDNARKLSLADDAANYRWGGRWRIPTYEELQELSDRNKCVWTWTSVNGIDGYIVTGPSKKSIFLPVTGYVSGTTMTSADCGYYQSSDLKTNITANAIRLKEENRGADEWSLTRCRGTAIRAVFK